MEKNELLKSCGVLRPKNFKFSAFRSKKIVINPDIFSFYVQKKSLNPVFLEVPQEIIHKTMMCFLTFEWRITENVTKIQSFFMKIVILCFRTHLPIFRRFGRQQNRGVNFHVLD